MQSKYQKFEAVTIKRSQINKAEYNPRVIDKKEADRLKKNIKNVGLLDTIVVNKNTMNIVSGHQRIDQLDALERGKDYELTVALVDLTEKQEREQNIFMNNEFAQGNWDLEKLEALIPQIDIEEAGFDKAELALLDITFEPPTEDVPEDLESEEEKIQKIKDAKKAAKENTRDDDNSNYFISIIFPDVQSKEDFLYNLGVNKFEQYFKSDKFFDLIGYHEQAT